MNEMEKRALAALEDAKAGRCKVGINPTQEVETIEKVESMYKAERPLEGKVIAPLKGGIYWR